MVVWYTWSFTQARQGQGVCNRLWRRKERYGAHCGAEKQMEHWDLNEQQGLFSSLVFLLFFSPGWWGGGHVQRSSKVGNSFLPANQNKTCYSVSVVWDRNGQVKQAEASLCIIQTALTFSILDCFPEWMIVAGLSFGSIVIFSAGIWRWVQ